MRSNFPKLKPLHLLTFAVCSLAGSAAFAQSAATFEYRHPMTMASAVQSTEDGGGGSAETPEIAPTTLSLTATTLPEATVGELYDFDFRTLLTIEGDEPPALDDINWGLQGLEGYSTGEGPSLDGAGTLEWTPASKGTASFEVVAAHAGAEGQQVYTIVVNGAVLEASQISAGSYHTCAVTTAGGLTCWGLDNWGQLGDGGSNTSQDTPADVAGLTSGVASVSAGNSHTCAVTTEGGVKCWGYAGNGQLGNGDTGTNQSTPADVIGLASGVVSVSAGTNHTCAVTTTGGVKCWGSDGSGQLGDGGASTNTSTPVGVSGLSSGAASVAAGHSHTCAVTTAGGVKCWGSGYYGQLGNGDTTNQPSPVNVSGLSSGAASVSAGNYHTCAVTKSGGVKCWGYDYYGQLGDGGTGTNQLAPVNVTGLTSGVASLSAGGQHTCAVTTAGGVMCWGYGDHGQLGTGGGSTDRPTLLNISGVVSITGGQYHTCAVPSSGEVKCWGNDSQGQLGDGGTNTNQPTPVDVLP